jgi:hypothetical protein
LNISHLKAKEQVKCFIIKTDIKHAEEDFAIALHSGHKYFTIIIKDEIPMYEECQSENNENVNILNVSPTLPF